MGIAMYAPSAALETGNANDRYRLIPRSGYSALRLCRKIGTVTSAIVH